MKNTNGDILIQLLPTSPFIESLHVFFSTSSNKKLLSKKDLAEIMNNKKIISHSNC
jgi:hypothetical protein